MSKPSGVNIAPDVLIWARRSSGYKKQEDIQSIADKLGIDLSTFESWESGELQPTISKLRKLAKIYHYPLAVFLLPKPPPSYETPFNVVRDFRRDPSDLDSTSSPALHLELRMILDRRNQLLDLLEQMEEKPPSFELQSDANTDPEKLAISIRKQIGITVSDQYKWKSSSEALANWRAAIESLGVLVFQTGYLNRMPISLKEMKGIAYSLKPYPVIVLNHKDYVNSKIFSLLHELGHLILNLSAISDIAHYESPSTFEQNIEQFCNHFAGAFLVPLSNLLQDKDVVSHAYQQWNADDLKGVAKRFSVSQIVIARRLLYAQKIDVATYRTIDQELTDEFNNSKQAKSQGFGRAPYHRRYINRYGKTYIQTLFDAYYQNVITLSSLSNYLGAKSKHTPGLEHEIMGYSSGLVKA